MKSFILLLVGLGIGLVGSVIYFRAQQAPVPPPTPGFVSTPTPTAPPEAVVATPVPEPAVIEKKPEPVPAVAANPVKTEAESETAAAFRKTIDALLAPELPLWSKHLLFEQLRNSGQIDAAITELQTRAKENPGAANLHTTLGEAMLNKVRLLHETGADVNEQGILAMQADQSFNAALKADPTNWEAQFVKYSTMVYWPADAKRDNEAAQKLSGLIDQQEALPQQSHFAQSYIALGNQYQKMGKPDFAEATWRLGLAKFPNDPTLLSKLAR